MSVQKLYPVFGEQYQDLSFSIAEAISGYIDTGKVTTPLGQWLVAEAIGEGSATVSELLETGYLILTNTMDEDLYGKLKDILGEPRVYEKTRLLAACRLANDESDLIQVDVRAWACLPVEYMVVR